MNSIKTHYTIINSCIIRFISAVSILVLVPVIHGQEKPLISDKIAKLSISPHWLILEEAESFDAEMNFTSYDGETTTPNVDTYFGKSYISRELTLLKNPKNTWATDYLIGNEYGSLTFDDPDVDANGNGHPDLTELNGPLNGVVEFTTPNGTIDFFEMLESDFTPSLRQYGSVAGRVVYADPPDACGILQNSEEMKGNIALVDRGNCNFYDKILLAQEAGALAVIIVNNAGGPLWMTSPGGTADIPAVSISDHDGSKIKQQLSEGVQVNIKGPIKKAFSAEFVQDFPKSGIKSKASIEFERDAYRRWGNYTITITTPIGPMEFEGRFWVSIFLTDIYFNTEKRFLRFKLSAEDASGDNRHIDVLTKFSINKKGALVIPAFEAKQTINEKEADPIHFNNIELKWFPQLNVYRGPVSVKDGDTISSWVDLTDFTFEVSRYPDLPHGESPQKNLRDTTIDNDIYSLNEHLISGTNLDLIDSEGWTALTLATYNGHIDFVETLLFAGVNIEKENKDKWNALHLAAKMGHIEIVKILILYGANIEAKYNYRPDNPAMSLSNTGSTPLYSAATANQIEVVKYLVLRGANIEAITETGWNALHTASLNGAMEVVEFLIESGINVDSKTLGHDEHTPLHLVSAGGHLEVIKFLLDKGADIEVVSSSGNTPLLEATQQGHKDVVKLLIQRGANIDAEHGNWNALHLATVYGHKEIVEYLLTEGFKVNQRTILGRTALDLANQYEHIELAQFLVSKGGDDGEGNNLLLAANDGNVDMVRLILTGEGNIEGKDENGWNPLLSATYYGYLETVKLLLAQGANIEAKLESGTTSLYWASRKGHLDVVKFLISKGADIEAKTNFGWTPLLIASYYGQLEIVKFLLAQGANIEAKLDSGSTSLYLASGAGHKDVVEFLVSKVADIDAKKDNGWNPLLNAASNGQLEIVKLLVAQGANIAAKLDSGETPLYWASHNGHLEVVEFLVSEGADIEAKGLNGWKPFLVAASNGHLAIVKLLVAQGANIEAKLDAGTTSLNYASLNGHLEVVEFLVSEGADIEAKGLNGWTPLIDASYSGHLEVVKLLLNEGASLEARDGNYDATPLVWSVLASGFFNNFPADYKFEDHDKIFELLLSMGANINAADNEGDTAFDNACLHNRPKVIDQLKDYIVIDNLKHTSSGKLRMNIKMIRKGSYKNTSEEIVITIPELKYEVQASKNFLDWKTMKEIKNIRSLHLFVDSVSPAADTSNYYRVKLAE